MGTPIGAEKFCVAILKASCMYSDCVIARFTVGCAYGMAAAVLFLPVGAKAQPVGALDLIGSTRVAAQDSVSEQGLGLRLGYNSDYRKATLAYETPMLWAYRFKNGWGRVGLTLEFGVSYWEAKRYRSKSMGQIGAIPMLRWWPTERFYLELGSGPTMLSRSEFAGHDLSTRLQFGSHVGTGLLINKVHRLGIRYSHYSNASIKKPNPGLDLLELSYTYQF